MPIVVEAQHFLYTAPDDMLDEMAGLPPREPLPVTELLPLVQALEIEPWIDQAIDKAAQDDVPFQLEPGLVPTSTWTPIVVTTPTPTATRTPTGAATPTPSRTPTPTPTTPPPPGGAFVVRGVGGPLEDPQMQQAVAAAVDWTSAATRLPASALPIEGPIASLVFPGLETTTDQVAFDPEKSRQLRDDAGVPFGTPILILLSQQDDDLYGVAKWINGDLLTHLGLEPNLKVEPPENIQPLIDEFTAADVALLWVAWE
jgi:hypothetical protein